MGGSLGDNLAFDIVEAVSVLDPKSIHENAGAWIGVRIVPAHSAASGAALAMIKSNRRSCVQASRSNISNIAT